MRPSLGMKRAVSFSCPTTTGLGGVLNNSVLLRGTDRPSTRLRCSSEPNHGVGGVGWEVSSVAGAVRTGPFLGTEGVFLGSELKVAFW